MQRTRILMVDDSPEFLRAAARFLAADPRIEIVGCVLRGREALEQMAALRPDLILLDLAMPGTNGLEVTRLIKAQPGAPRVIIVSLHDQPAYREKAKAMGADAFVAKTDVGDKLLPLIYSLFPNGAVPAPAE